MDWQGFQNLSGLSPKKARKLTLKSVEGMPQTGQEPTYIKQ